MRQFSLLAEKSPLLVVSLYIAFLGATFAVGALSIRAIETENLYYRIADSYSSVLDDLHEYYSMSIVPNATNAGAKLSAGHDDSPTAIPFPATFINNFGQMMNERVNGLDVRLYSKFPFPWNRDRIQDEFEAEALAYLETSPDGEYYRFEDIDHGQRLRLARPILMKQHCVECHNTFDLGRESKWKVGDFRGVREVSIPVSNNAIFDHRVYVVAIMMALASVGVGGLVAWPAFRQLRTRLGQQTQLAVELHQVSRRDPLTGLPNRAALLETMDYMLALAGREKRRLSLIFMDLNGFKPINDDLGHHVGDLALKAVAEALTANLRESDFAARLGGDEFTIMVPSAAETCYVCGRIERAIAEISLPQLKAYTLGASLGVAMFPDDGTTASELLSAADSRMYEQKRARKYGSGDPVCPVNQDDTSPCDARLTAPHKA